MQINFTYEEGGHYQDHWLKTVTSDGLVLEIGFDGLDADVILIAGNEMQVASDDYKGLYVNFGTGLDVKLIPVANVIQQANAQIDGIVDEIAAEQRSWDRHVQSFSHPY